MSFREAVLGAAYRQVIKPVAFANDPERTHDAFVAMGKLLVPLRGLLRVFFSYRHPSLQQTVRGITFPNPVGLAAGFDKNAELIKIIPAMGFGFEEVGSITGEPCAGNPKPRLWRVPELQSIRVWYGLKNDGCESLACRIPRKRDVPLGISVAKTNSPATVDVRAGIADYVKAFRVLVPLADYVTVNVSCPNAYGGLPFEEPKRLNLLLSALDRVRTTKPVFLKFSSDVPFSVLDKLLAVASKHRVAGLVLTNLTKCSGKGGLSGGAVKDKSLAVLKHVKARTGNRFVLVSCGGIFTAEDAYERFRHGATLVQLVTSMIYRGPQNVSDINKGLVRLLRRDGFSSIADVTGAQV